MNPPDDTLEAQASLAPGRGITTRLRGNCVSVELCGRVSPDEQAHALPALLQLLADRAGVPVSYAGQKYQPRPQPDDGATWGESPPEPERQGQPGKPEGTPEAGMASWLP